MDIITRQQAITERRTKYFTGIPCKNGHTSERYTRCSVCVECLHPTFESVEVEARRLASVTRQAAVAGRLEDYRRTTAARLQLTRIKIVLHSGDFESFVAAAALLMSGREPALKREHVFTHFSPRQRGDNTALYAFKCFPDDAATLYQLAEDLSYARMSPEQQQLVRDAANRRIK